MTDAAECYACGETYPLDEQKRCDCGEPLWLTPTTARFDWPTCKERSMWRHGDLLPVAEPVGVGAGAGGTPLVRTERLDDVAGCQLYVKDEGENPTGSFKDRGSAVGVAYAAAHSRNCVGTVSHGNMAMSMAAHAAGHALGCVVLVPEDISADRLRNIAQYDPNILKVEGDYGRLYYDALGAGPEVGVEFVNSDTPLRVAGQKTVALEILEEFAPEVPDAIAIPTSSGGLASATWRAFKDLQDAGILDELPKLLLVQSAACDPIASAWREEQAEVTRVEAEETIAYSIANADPPSGNRALAAVRATDGAAVSVTDEEIQEAKRLLASRAGLCVEASSAVPLAGLRRFADEGHIDRTDRVAMVATGSGFKERVGALSVDAETVALEDVPERLRQLR